MAFGNLATAFNLDPGTAAALETRFGPPAPGPPAPPPVEDGAPTDEELARYGATPEERAVARRANSGATVGNPSNPVVADPKWDPAAESKRVNEEAGRKERAGATPQGPAGDDGFPTYRDLSATSSAAGGGGGGPVRIAPAHWQPGTRSESRQYGMNPDELVNEQYHRDAAAGHRMMSGDLRLEAAQTQGMADAVYAASHVAASQRAAAQMQRIEQDREAYVAREKEKLEGLAQAAQQQVDPEAAKGSLGSQLFATIGVALGQLGASLTGGKNTALEIVNTNIANRIDAQKANINNAGKAYDRENSLFKDNLEAFGSKERAALATKVQYLDQVKAMADQQYALGKATMNEADYHAFIGGVEEERAKAAKDFAVATHTQIATQGNEHYVPAQAVGGAGAGAKGREKLYVPSLGGYARDEESARKLNAHGALRTQVNEDLHEIHKLLEEAKHLSSVTDYGRMQEVRQRVDALKHGVLQKTTVLADQGAMSNGDKDVAEIRSSLQAVDPQLKTEAQIARMQKGLVGVAKSHQRDARLEAESYGIQLGREEYRPGVSGPEPTAHLAGSNKVVTKKTENVDDLMEAPKGVSQRK